MVLGWAFDQGVELSMIQSLAQTFDLGLLKKLSKSPKSQPKKGL